MSAADRKAGGIARELGAVAPFAMMCVGMFIALLDIQIVASSLQDIGGGLSAAQDQLGWVQTAYLIAEIIMIPLSGWLTRVFSTRWLFAASAVGFTIASTLCGLAWNIESMIVFRALQGMLGAAMVPTVFTSSFHYFQGQRRVYAAAVIGTIASIAPTLGPVLGGWITDTLSWHWLFYVNVLPGFAVAAGVAYTVDIDQPNLRLLKQADYPGMLLLALFLGSLEYVLEDGARWNWFDDDVIRNFTVIAVIAGVLFISRSLTCRQPVVDLRALTNRNFAIGCFLSFVTGMGMFAPIYLTPLFLSYVRGFSAWQTGMAIYSTGAASLIGVPIYIALAMAEFNGCDYCLSVHTYLARNVTRLDDSEITANRNGASNDLKADAAVRFAIAVARSRGHVSRERIDDLREAGYDDGQVIEIVQHVALNTFTNYLNEIAATPIDFPVVFTRSKAPAGAVEEPESA